MNGRSEMWAKCKPCGAVFKVCDLPLPIGLAAKAMMHAECPKCAAQSKDLLLPSEAEISAAKAAA